jgi:hypothetical protein
MDEKEYQLEIIQQLENNEEVLSELYDIYSHKFSSMHEFWSGLVEDEKSHAQWVRTLKRKIEEGEVHIKDHRFNIDIIRDFNKDVENKKIEISKDDIPLVVALGNAVNFEKTMIERNFFEVFNDDTPEIKMLLLALEYSTRNHLLGVQEAYNTEKLIQKI